VRDKIYKYSKSIFYSILIITLFFGLYPKGFYFINNVRWSKDSPGIDFGKFGIAHTEPFIEETGSDHALSIDIVIKPSAGDGNGFSHILTLHNGDDEAQLLMGQWRSSIVFMNGNDYENREKTKKIRANTADAESDEIFITVASGTGGTSLYFNGQQVKKNEGLILKVPGGDNKLRLILANSIYGKQPWKGRIRGLAFYRNVLSDQQAALHYSEWMKEGNLGFAEKENPWILYTFDEKSGITAVDHGTGKYNLTMPERMTVFKRVFLEYKGFKAYDEKDKLFSFISDLVVNLLGFIPFGFMVSLILFKANGKFPIHYILISVAAGFLLSLMIEILQAWLPSRSSDMNDLILNTSGALLGAVIFRGVRHEAEGTRHEARG
jgi:VanZ family protein